MNEFNQKFIHELFEEQVIIHPIASAIIFKDTKISYNELNQRANQLAHFLCSKGVKEESLVPVCINLSIEMVIGILGILKAGAAYVPIDPNTPPARINYILEDIKAAIIICNHDSKIKLEAIKDVRLVEVCNTSSLLRSQPNTNLPIRLSLKNLAYVIYTSGSTGKPKGVMIEHGNLINYVCNGKTKYISDNENLSGSFIHLSYTFDASITAFFMPLINGKRTVISASQSPNGFEDPNLWKYAPYDFIKITPSHLGILLPLLKKEDGELLTKKLVVGGEALHKKQFSELGKNGIDITIINEYGPTEATVGCTTYVLNSLQEFSNTTATIPIGKPIENVKAYIIDEIGKLVTTGIAGEICIGGNGLARGYLNNEDLTAQKFIKDLYEIKEEATIYKTGDIGTWLPDGNIEYLGRKDDQVKVHGYRIEPGEIEATILQSNLVREVAVLAHQDDQGNNRLVGYVVPESSFTKKTITSFLSDRLPDYMIPTLWVQVENFPLTTHGKIDKKYLETLKEGIHSTTYVPPQTETQATLATLWQTILRKEKVGINDNFFELGGNSIQATILFSKIQSVFHKNLPLATLLISPTIKELSFDLFESTEKEAEISSLVPIQPYGFHAPLFCVHAGAGDVLFYRSLSQELGNNQPVYGLQAMGIDGNKIPYSSMEDMAKYYIKEIRKVQPEGQYYLAGYCLGAIISFEMAQQLTKQGEKVALLANFNGITPFYQRPENLNIDSNGTQASLYKQLQYYWNNVEELSLKHKLIYMLKKLKAVVVHKIRRWYFTFLYVVYSVISNMYNIAGRAQPKNIAKSYTGLSLYKMERKYKLKPYKGSMIIFRSPRIFSTPHLGWKTLVEGGIKTINIPGEHKGRRDIMNEPHVKSLAKELKVFLK